MKLNRFITLLILTVHIEDSKRSSLQSPVACPCLKIGGIRLLFGHFAMFSRYIAIPDVHPSYRHQDIYDPFTLASRFARSCFSRFS